VDQRTPSSQAICLWIYRSFL